MKVFVSVDMEGSTGLERLEEIFRGLPGFDTFRQVMAGDCNAVIKGAIEGGADEVVVSDSHGYMCNMHPDDLIRGVQLRSPRPNERDIENLIDLVAEDIVGGDCPLNEIGPRRRPG